MADLFPAGTARAVSSLIRSAGTKPLERISLDMNQNVEDAVRLT
jgi:hypothetical protein